LAWAGSSLYVGGSLSSLPIPYTTDSAYQLDAVYYRNGIKTVLPRGTYYGAKVNSILVVER